MKIFILVLYLHSNGQTQHFEYATFHNAEACNWAGSLIASGMEYEMDGIISVGYSCTPFTVY